MSSALDQWSRSTVYANPTFQMKQAKGRNTQSFSFSFSALPWQPEAFFESDFTLYSMNIKVEHFWTTPQEWSLVRGFLSACEKILRNRDLSFLKDTVSLPDYVFMALTGVLSRSEFTSDYSLQLDLVAYMTVGEKVSCGLQLGCHAWLVVARVRYTHVISLNTQSINCPML